MWRGWSPQVGDVVGINPGYISGLWLRSGVEVNEVDGSRYVKVGDIVIVLEVSGGGTRDPWIRVMASNGVDGWTQVSRLMELD